jgi:maltooligosyltrehalose trehalohydrolase
VGNRALGDRLNHDIDLAAFRAASVVLLTAPQTPLLFMGQEWAASSPFQYFTDHHEELGRLVTEGRRREFSTFSAFSEPSARARIPDPQAVATFLTSRLDWTERHVEPHASMERLYATVLAVRRRELGAADESLDGFTAQAPDEATIVVRRTGAAGVIVLIVARLQGAGTIDLGESDGTRGESVAWDCLLTSEDVDFSPTPAPPLVDCSGRAPTISFPGPSAVILRSRRLQAAA